MSWTNEMNYVNTKYKEVKIVAHLSNRFDSCEGTLAFGFLFDFLLLFWKQQ